MKILLDECLPRRLVTLLAGHEAQTVGDMRWSGVKNGWLLERALGRFDVFITADQNLQCQQNLKGSSLAVIVLKANDNRFETLRDYVPGVLQSLTTIKPGDLVEIESGKP